MRRICGLPAEAIPLNVIPVGAPADRNAQPKDKYKPENVHWDRW